MHSVTCVKGGLKARGNKTGVDSLASESGCFPSERGAGAGRDRPTYFAGLLVRDPASRTQQLVFGIPRGKMQFLSFAPRLFCGPPLRELDAHNGGELASCISWQSRGPAGDVMRQNLPRFFGSASHAPNTHSGSRRHTYIQYLHLTDLPTYLLCSSTLFERNLLI